MSWSLSLQEVAEDDLEEALAQRKLEYDHTAEGVDDQMEVAKEAVEHIVKSGAVGHGPFNLSLAGHAEPSEGSGWHSMSISVAGPNT